MELLLGGTAQRCRIEVQQARSDSSSTCLFWVAGRPIMSRARSRTRRYSGGQRQKHANLRYDNVWFCVRLQCHRRRVATVHLGLRSRPCKRSQDQLHEMKGHCRRWRSTVLAQRQLSIRVIVERGGRASQVGRLDLFQRTYSCRTHGQPSSARRGRRSLRGAWIPASPPSQCGPNVF